MAAVIAVVSLIVLNVSLSRVPTVPVGGGVSISNFNSFASSSAITVSNSSTQVSATNTARTYLRLANNGSAAVYCNLRNGAAATLFSGLTIFGSSTVDFTVDNNPYTGAVNCIGHGTNIVSVLER